MRWTIFMATLALAASTGLASPAFAGGGVVELNQTCAVQTGCFNGDTPGFPITIGASGSYVLTGNLTLSDANAVGIEVAAGFVSIDLAGFSLSGPITCTGFGFNRTLVCGAGTGDAITALNQPGLTVQNGTIRGFADTGLTSNGAATTARDLMFHENGVAAMQLGGAAHVRNVVAQRNGGSASQSAILAGTGSSVENVVVIQSQNEGIVVGSWSVVRGNSATSNGSSGMRAGFASTVVHNSAAGNGGDGIIVGKNSQVSDNASGQNTGDGIQTSNDSNVQRNTVSENAGYGIRITGANSAYRENQISNNTLGTVLGGVNTGSNLCNGSSICP